MPPLRLPDHGSGAPLVGRMPGVFEAEAWPRLTYQNGDSLTR